MAKWSKAKIVGFSILAVLMIAVVVFLCFVPTFQREMEITKHYNARLSQFETERSSAINKKVLFVGDELVENFDLSTYYPLLDAYNMGIAGDTTKRLQKRLESSVLNTNPSVCVFLVGTNNLKSAVKGYTKILNTIKTKTPNIKVIVQSIYPTNYGYKKRNAKILEVNEKLKELTLSFGYVYFDAHSVLVDDSGLLAENYTTDGLNLNDSGYKKVTEKLSYVLSDTMK